MFLSCTRLVDDRHREYNAWHQLDHRPEVLTQPDVAAGDRWVRPPDFVPATAAVQDPLVELQYVTMYWYRQPGPLGRLAPLHFQLGRRGDLDHGQSLLAGVFVPVKGYTHPRLPVGPDVLPLRPARGVHLRIADHHGDPVALGASFRWSDADRLPALVALDGVAGAWLFVDPEGLAASGRSPVRRVELFYLDGDPLEVSARLVAQDKALAASSGGRWPPPGVVLFDGPLSTIVPWEWDWFDR